LGFVTAFEFRLYPVGPFLLGGPVFWPISDAPAVLRAVREYMPNAPDELGVAFTTRPAPPVPFLSPQQYFTPVVGLVLVWCGDPADGEKAMAPLREVGTPLCDVVRLVPYLAIQSMLDSGSPHGVHYYWRSQRLGDLDEAVIGTLVEATEASPTFLSNVAGFAFGGAVTRVDPDATAVGAREPGYELNVVAAWPAPDPNGAAHTEWVRTTSDRLRPSRTGVWSHFLSDEGTAGVEEAYGDRIKRLTALKDRYDPTNFFRLNANVPPSEGGSR
jgi:FAD/FMN-containing dehydrogenase